MLRKIGIAAGAASGAGVVYVYNDPGLSRQAVFWGKVGQGVVHYTYTKKVHDFHEYLILLLGIQKPQVRCPIVFGLSA